MYLPAHGREIPDPLKAEARSRGLELPPEGAQFKLVAGKKFANVEVFEVDDEDDFTDYDWPDPND